ncbi:MAG TPA: hypothetical protein P5116_08100 [Eubacteriales bacterium]|nr:hypothetical protein [Clostridia bacterium]HRV73820.1 hypothetical protein [Eubacteriales bacterium]
MLNVYEAGLTRYYDKMGKPRQSRVRMIPFGPNYKSNLGRDASPASVVACGRPLSFGGKK